jgi:hypothetical protein
MKKPVKLKEVKENILATLIYFDLFRYPLTGNEIYLFLRSKADQADVDLSLKYLVADQSVYQFGDYYTLQNNHMLVVRRINGNQNAADVVKDAEKMSDGLIKLPFVRGIAMSGSTSKNLADDHINLFIITAKNKLWIARAFIYAFNKFSLLINKQDLFLADYFIDEEQLEIKEKNVSTAVDVVSLIPLQGDMIMEQFYMANHWTRNYLPHRIMRVSSAKPAKLSVFKRVFEWLFTNALGNAIDNLSMRITIRRWQKNGKAINADKHHAKPDLNKFQSALLAQYQRQLSQILIEPQNLLAN